MTTVASQDVQHPALQSFFLRFIDTIFQHPGAFSLCVFSHVWFIQFSLQSFLPMLTLSSPGEVTMITTKTRATAVASKDGNNYSAEEWFEPTERIVLIRTLDDERSWKVHDYNIGGK